MPALTMRGRYLMREYWSDSDLFLRLTADEREVYQGLWMLSDDDGWMPRDIHAIAAALYRYEDRAPREEKVSGALRHLREMGKVESHRCCLHLRSVAAYPRAGKKSDVHAQEHWAHSKRPKRIQTNSNPSHQPHSNGSPVVTSSLPDVAPARAPEGAAAAPSEFRQRVPRPA
jgi:hypothetical protein